jgi:hypothetical protein
MFGLGKYWNSWIGGGKEAKSEENAVPKRKPNPAASRLPGAVDQRRLLARPGTGGGQLPGAAAKTQPRPPGANSATENTSVTRPRNPATTPREKMPAAGAPVDLVTAQPTASSPVRNGVVKGTQQTASSPAPITASSLQAERPSSPEIQIANQGLVDRPSSPQPVLASSPPAESSSTVPLPQGRSGAVPEKQALHMAPPAPKRMQQEPMARVGRPAGGNPLTDLRNFLIEFEARNPEFGTRLIAPETVADYSKVAQRVLDRNDPPNRSGHRSSYRQKIRAAIRYIGWIKINQILDAIEHGGVDPDDVETYVEEGTKWSLRIMAIEADTGEGGASSNTMRRTSRRKKLAKLPEGWELTFFEAARQHPAWFLGICTMLAVGARPIEVRRGVVVRRVRDGIEIAVKCAKQPRQPDALPGQPAFKWRYLELSDDTHWARALMEAVGESSELLVTWPSAKKSYDKVVTIARQVGITAPRSISPYVFRHRFGCLLKRGEFSDEEISRALGHTDGDIKSTYGTWNGRISGGGRPLRIQSDLEVKEPRKKRRYSAKKDAGPAPREPK